MINEICRDCKHRVDNEVGRDIGCGEYNTLIQFELEECDKKEGKHCDLV